MKPIFFHRNTGSFTLVELLVVIGILAILTAAVVIVLNPAELLKQSRDSKRTTDLASLNNTIKFLLTQSPDVNLGAASTVYLSLPDSSLTCSSYTLPALPSGWQYRCATSANYQKIDGSGWVPVNFSSVSDVASLAVLPADPQNTSQNYYSYVAGGSWQIVASFESDKYAKKEVGDGGLNPASYEVGSNLSLAPFLGGLVGYWSFDETSGTTVYDGSGWGRNGTMYSSSTPSYLGAESGCKTGRCARFNGIDTYVAYAPILMGGNGSDAAISVWINRTGSTLSYAPLVEQGGNRRFRLVRQYDQFCFGNDEVTNNFYCTPNTFSATSFWYHVTAVFDGSYHIFVNGVEAPLTRFVNSYASMGLDQLNIGYRPYNGIVGPWKGLIDDVRIYSRALSNAEIQAIYNATK